MRSTWNQLSSAKEVRTLSAIRTLAIHSTNVTSSETTGRAAVIDENADDVDEIDDILTDKKLLEPTQNTNQNSDPPPGPETQQSTT